MKSGSKFLLAEKDINKNWKTVAAKLTKGTQISSHNTPILKDALKLPMAEKESKEARKLSEGQNLENRKTRIIVFNTAELKPETNEERKVEDSTRFINLCNSICEGNIPTSDVFQLRMLAKKPDDKSNRHLLIKLNPELRREKYLENYINFVITQNSLG